MTRVTMIAAVGRNGVIGDGTSMPWHLPEDFAFFKRTTMGHPMIMGRGTFDSIGRALPGRRSIVITGNPQWHHADVETAHSLAEAFALAGPADEVFICGGGRVYAEAMPFAQRLLVTEVDLEPEGSVHFPPIDPRHWQVVTRTEGQTCTFVEYARTAARTALLRGERVGRHARAKVGASAAIMHRGRLLLSRREDNGLWCLPGGGLDPGETWSEAAIREVAEEVGLEVRVTSVLSVYTDPHAVPMYRDGTRAQVFGVCFRGEPVHADDADSVTTSDEVVEVGWFDRTAALALAEETVALHRDLVAAAFEPVGAPTRFV